MPAPTPVEMLEAFANDADPAFIQIIPETTADPARASLDLGFPPQTMQPVIAGGTPPFGQDMNGVLYMISSHTVYQQSGQPYQYSAALAAKIGGYAVGTILGMADGAGLWINRTAANATNPDTGGAGWVPVYTYGVTTISGVTGGTINLTAAQARKKVIVLQGALVANVQVNVPALPGTVGDKFQDWLIVNQCSGAFSTTVKTSAGTGVVIPQGGNSAPVGVWSDGVNVYPLVAPVSLPIDQAPNPLTIAQRTNAGYLLATYFNQSSALENLTAAAIYFDIGDGYHRKIAPVNLAAQMALSWFGGQVSNGQVPFSAVLQYAAALFSSPSFTGVPTAPTAAPGTNDSQVATTAFVQSQVLGSSAQAWSNPLRFANTPYTNTTGRPIMVNVDFACGSGGTGIFYVNGVAVKINSHSGAGVESAFSSAIVPPGAVYQLTLTGPTSLDLWAELS